MRLSSDPEDPELKEEKEVAPSVEEVETQPRPRGFFSLFRYYEAKLDRKLGIEPEDLRRVLPEERRAQRSYLAMGVWWASATMTLSCFSTGFLGYEFGLSMGESIGIIIAATFLGSAVAVCAYPSYYFPFFV